MAYQILDHKGTIISQSVSSEELTALIEGGEHNYFEHDSNPELDLLTRWAQAEKDGEVIEGCRIYKLIEE